MFGFVEHVFQIIRMIILLVFGLISFLLNKLTGHGH